MLLTKTAITARTWALLGFADATCVEHAPTEPTARRPPSRQPAIAHRYVSCRGRRDGQDILAGWPLDQGTAARSLTPTCGTFPMARRPATRPTTERAESGSSSGRARHASRRTPAASPAASRCVSRGMRRPSSNSSGRNPQAKAKVALIERQRRSPRPGTIRVIKLQNLDQVDALVKRLISGCSRMLAAGSARHAAAIGPVQRTHWTRRHRGEAEGLLVSLTATVTATTTVISTLTQP